MPSGFCGCEMRALEDKVSLKISGFKRDEAKEGHLW
jgi:hypothetical protein